MTDGTGNRRPDRGVLMNRAAAFTAVCLAVLVSSVRPLYADGSSPYYADGQVSLVSAPGKFDRAGMYITFYNKSDKTVRNVTFDFFLYDSGGDPPFAGTNSITAVCVQDVEAYGSAVFCISLDRYVISPPEEPYQTDYIYASRIEYDDGTVWDDPYGLYAMQ